MHMHLLQTPLTVSYAAAAHAYVAHANTPRLLCVRALACDPHCWSATGCWWRHAGDLKDKTAAFLRQLQIPRLPLPLRDLGSFVAGPLLGSGGVVVRLPVADHLYMDLTNGDPAFEDILQPVSACGAYKLSLVTSAALSAEIDTPDDEITVAGEPRSSGATNAHMSSRTVLWHANAPATGGCACALCAWPI